MTLFFVIFGLAPTRSYRIGVVGNNWLVDWLICNAVFPETALRIFQIFGMKLGNYKGKKVTEPDFWKKLLIWRYSRKRLQISPKPDTLIFFSRTAPTIFLVFGLKLVLNMTFNLNKNLFFRSCNLEIFGFEIVQKLPKLRFLAIFSTLHL